MRRQETLPLGVVIERRKIDNPWQDYTWRPVAVIPGASPCDPRGAWKEIGEGEGWVRYHAGTLNLNLFRKETEGYRVNLSQDPPRIFVCLRSGEDMDCEHEVAPFLVTVCPYEAQDYQDSGEEIVETVAMPDGVVAFVQAYIDEHHVDEPFYKRKRKGPKKEDESFARRPRVADPSGSNGRGNGRLN